MPLLGADPINQAYHYLAGNRAALPGAIYAMIVIAGAGSDLRNQCGLILCLSSENDLVAVR